MMVFKTMMLKCLPLTLKWLKICVHVMQRERKQMGQQLVNPGEEYTGIYVLVSQLFCRFEHFQMRKLRKINKSRKNKVNLFCFYFIKFNV